MWKEKQREEEREVDEKITYKNGQDVAWLNIPPRQESDKLDIHYRQFRTEEGTQW